jgi:hypothetical protein
VAAGMAVNTCAGPGPLLQQIVAQASLLVSQSQTRLSKYFFGGQIERSVHEKTPLVGAGFVHRVCILTCPRSGFQ